mgnify:FL=1
MYQTLYRKYRPLNLDEVVGQQVIVKTLKNAILNNQLSHAYLFTGPRGTGKTSIAKILARTINCTNLNDTTPCNKCVNCTQNLNQPVDIIEIDAASNNGVDEIRELKSKVNLVPTINKYKVYIIDEVHMLTTGAFNALLKTLEEPPAHIIFILATTEPHKIPMTILSRCQRFDFKRISNRDLVKRLKYVVDQEKIKIEENCLEEIARLSNGGMRDALSILDQVNAYADDQIKIEQIHEINGTLTPVEIKNFILNIKNKKLEEILELIEQYDNKGKDFVKLAEEILVYLKNLIFKFNVPKYFESLNIDFNDYDIEKIDIDELINYVQNFNDIINELKKSSNPKLIFELSIIKIISKNSKSEEVKTDIPVIPKEKPKAEKKEVEKQTSNNKIDINILNELQKIRINNTLCNFNKKEYLELKSRMNEINRLVIDPEYSEYAAIVLDGTLKAVGQKNLIFVYENIHNAKIYNENVIKIDEMFEFIFKEKYISIATDIDNWNKIKQEFNNKQKKYEYIDEPKKLLEKLQQNNSENNIEKTFGNIIEYS